MAKKKKNNPFKLWGSYVGAYLLPAIFVYVANEKTTVGLTNALTWFLSLHSLTDYTRAGVVLIIGFLIGWGIHSLIRSKTK